MDLAKAKLFNMTMPIDCVIFDLNPKDLSISSQHQMSTRGSYSASQAGGSQLPGGGPAGNTGAISRGQALRRLTFTALLDDDYSSAFDVGPVTVDSVGSRCELLYSWTKPNGGSMLGALAGAAISAITGGRVNLTAMPPLLTFQWGDPFDGGITMNGYLESVKCKYLRFTHAGNPTRASVDVTFAEETRSLLNMLTNPTSGGLPGRRAHVVSQGESLQSIATATYGRPGLWRHIADANGIDDPMHLPPGTTIYLPSPHELELSR